MPMSGKHQVREAKRIRKMANESLVKLLSLTIETVSRYSHSEHSTSSHPLPAGYTPLPCIDKPRGRIQQPRGWSPKL